MLLGVLGGDGVKVRGFSCTTRTMDWIITLIVGGRGADAVEVG